MEPVNKIHKEILDEWNMEKITLSRVKDEVDFWKDGIGLGWPKSILQDQESIILETAKVYCGERTKAHFDYDNKKVKIIGQNRVEIEF